MSGFVANKLTSMVAYSADWQAYKFDVTLTASTAASATQAPKNIAHMHGTNPGRIYMVVAASTATGAATIYPPLSIVVDNFYFIAASAQAGYVCLYNGANKIGKSAKTAAAAKYELSTFDATYKTCNVGSYLKVVSSSAVARGIAVIDFHPAVR